MTISISGSLPQGDGNGLTAVVGDLVHDPKAYHVIIGIVDCKKITTNPDSGEIIPTARIRRIEVVTAADLKVAETLMRRALDKRTGRETLPFDLEQDLRAAFPEDES